MIQRIQSLYLFLIVLFGSGLLIYSHQSNEASWVVEFKGYLVTPLGTIFTLLLFKKRMLQARFCFVLILIQMTLVGHYGFNLVQENLYEMTYPALGVSFINSILLIFARKAILKDEALVRSIDRIR